MADNAPVQMKSTLGLTGLTMNAMALIAPGAFLWLTFQIQATTGVTAPAMWIGIVVALLLCLATAVCYAEMAKLYPGTGSSYYFAEQAFLNHERVWRYARLAKFIVGWGSHVYYWVYPGVMVGVMGILCGYLVGTLWPSFMSASNPGPAFMMVIAIAFSFLVGYIAHRGINGSTAVSIAINVIQISALVLFSVVALSYRINHAPGSIAYQFDSTSSEAYSYEFATEKTVANGQATETIVRDANGAPKPKLDAAGKPVPYHIGYPAQDEKGNFLAHAKASSVVGFHNLGWAFIQATVAILILVGFESVTAMGGEAKNARRDIPIAVLVSLLVQGVICYLFEYFAAAYFLNSGYTMHNAGARVTYAMGKDRELHGYFGELHAKNLSPHRAIWTLAAISAVIGCVAVMMPFGDAGAPADAAIKALPQGFWSSFGYTTHDGMAALPSSLLTMTLASNFGTFLLYGLSCIICLVAYHKHPKFSLVRHLLIPVFGLVANLACMAFYLVGPFMGYGTKMEPLLALGIALVWAIYGGIYFIRASKVSGRTTLVAARSEAV